MATEAELKTQVQTDHAALEKQYYEDGTIDKATFDAQHGALFDQFRADMIAEGHIVVQPPARDLEAELDAALVRIAALEKV
jgi:hypothetical protein